VLRTGESYDFYKSVDMQEDLNPLVKYFEEYGKVMPVDQDRGGEQSTGSDAA